METGGRKKSVAKPTPPTHDPRNVETIERLKENPRYVNRLYQPLCKDHVLDHNDRYRDDLIRSLGLKIEIPVTCKVRPDDFIDWLSTVERVFDVRDIPNKLKVKFMAIKLQKHALLWGDHVINEFYKLRMRCDVVKEEEQFVARFLGVLKLEIVDIVSLQPCWTNMVACRLALKVEKYIKAKNKGSTSRFTPPTRTASPIAPKTAPKGTTPTTSAVGTTKEHVDNAPHCYKYGWLRHYARDCPNLKTLAFVPDDAALIYDTDAEPELDKLVDELVYPDCGEALVI
uniref:Reverse transcriptase domain-containing protein n=1 Tax=Tanacetum cinerariifolium TaxID=118510 RepID=A0A6L2MY55_TANCI|nr:hypothetical protein [Tanacetum cinerariifolium]